MHVRGRGRVFGTVCAYTAIAHRSPDQRVAGSSRSNGGAVPALAIRRVPRAQASSQPQRNPPPVGANQFLRKTDVMRGFGPHRHCSHVGEKRTWVPQAGTVLCRAVEPRSRSCSRTARKEINRRIIGMHAEILAVQAKPDLWYALFQTVSGPFWQDLSGRLVALVEVGRSGLDLEALRKLQEVAAQAERHHLAVQRTLDELVTWGFVFEQYPVLFTTKSIWRFSRITSQLSPQPTA